MTENKAFIEESLEEVSSDDLKDLGTLPENKLVAEVFPPALEAQELKLNLGEIRQQKPFKVYKIRWGVLLSVVLLNISNAAIWINNSPTTTTVSKYYGIKTEQVNWFSLLYLFAAIPGAFYGSYCVDTLGLKKTILVGSCLNVTGSLIRLLATSGIISDVSVQFPVALTGQLFCAVASNFIIYLHTKVSQTWFAEDQRGIATTFLSMSNPMGIVVAEVSVPFIISSEEDIPLNDKIWFTFALVVLVIVLVFVRRASPKTPPSRSAGASKGSRPPYLQQLKMAFTTVPFLMLLLSLGGGIAFTIAIATLTQQILCPLGYSEEFGGGINGLMLLCGFVGALFSGMLLDRTKMYTEITMYLFGLAAVVGIIFFEFLLLPHREVAIALLSALFGIFGVSLFPVGLELAVETVYPVEESITVAFIFLAGQLIAIIIILIVPALAFDKADTSLSVCDLDSEAPKDYTVSLIVVMIFLVVVSCTSIAFFKTEYKRQAAEKREREREEAEQQQSQQKHLE